MQRTMEMIHHMRLVADAVYKGSGKDKDRRSRYLRNLADDAMAEVDAAVGALGFTSSALQALRYNPLLLRVECTAPTQHGYEQARQQALRQIAAALAGLPARPAPPGIVTDQSGVTHIVPQQGPQARKPWEFPQFGADSMVGGPR